MKGTKCSGDGSRLNAPADPLYYVSGLAWSFEQLRETIESTDLLSGIPPIGLPMKNYSIFFAK